MTTARVVLAVFCVGLMAALAGAQQSNAAEAASIPHMIRFSGTLTDSGGRPAHNPAGVTFALYRDEQGGAPLWMETQTVKVDASGRYSVMLGATKSGGLPAELFLSKEARWLGVEPQGLPAPARVLLLSVPYALKAGDAETIGGLPPSAFVLAAPPSGGQSSTADNGGVNPNAPPPAAVTGAGTANHVPLWTWRQHFGGLGSLPVGKRRHGEDRYRQYGPVGNSRRNWRGDDPWAAESTGGCHRHSCCGRELSGIRSGSVDFQQRYRCDLESSVPLDGRTRWQQYLVAFREFEPAVCHRTRHRDGNGAED